MIDLLFYAAKIISYLFECLRVSIHSAGERA